MKTGLPLAVALLSFAAPAAAQTATPSPWSASTSLGASQSSGSTSYTSLTGEQDAAYAGTKWQTSLQLTGSYARNKYKSPIGNGSRRARAGAGGRLRNSLHAQS